MKLINDYLYALIINSYYENIYDVSLNLLLSNHYIILIYLNSRSESIRYNINQIYDHLIKNARSDILKTRYIRNEYHKEIKLALPEQEDEHVKEAQKDYTSQRKMLRSAKNNQLEINNEETKPFEVDFYLPFYVKNRKDNNILNSFSLQSLLLVGFYESFETPLFSSILYEQTNIETVKNDIHPLCYKMILYFQKNTSFLIKKKLALKQLSILFCILNSYLSFATLQHASFYTQKNISRFLIFKNSQREINRLNELYSNGNYYFPTNFLHKFLDTFLLKKDNAYIMTEQYKCKLMVYILLIQLCLTDNALPLNLSLINRNTGLILRKLHFSIKDKNIITFNLNE
ncbi:hypothetical protein PFDG_02257 [Plasmodium falciparum Dd2]|uniref:Uncharacterized protein n=1 Tax=Plasmodium falciparum (isolate Dd2) TaxID=57267 RepID=A0A0L7M162_PLAF4|nr:hypothetical protein PFDG_02257 [Plasmodium falciparum Dd2]